MVDIFFLNNVFLFLVSLVGIGLAFWVYIANPKERINQLFLLFTICNLLWIIFTHLSDILDLSKQINIAILFRNLAYGSGFLFFISTYFFVSFFPYKTKRNKFLDGIILVIGLGLFLTAAFTRFIVKSVEPKIWGNSPVFNEGAFLAYGGIIFFTIIILGILIRKYSSLPENKKLKTQYFLLGIIIFALGNFIFNIILAPQWKNFPYYYFGNYSAIFLIGFTGYAIVAKELFGIRVILTQALVVVVAILLLAQALTSTSWPEFAWKLVLFLIFLPFGYFLIQSVTQEIKRRAEIQRLYEEVDRLSRAKSEFISIASHQLRTPLTAIKGYISMLIEGSYGKFDDKGKRPLQRVFDSNERLINLVNDLLNVSRIESGTLKVEPKKTSLENMISSILDELRIKAQEKNLYLNWEKHPSLSSGQALPEVMVDPGKMRQVIMNIVDNCIKYTDSGGVTVTTELKKPLAKKEPETILIVIKDTGEGMAKGEIGHLFESFTRGTAGAKNWTGGAGLGLYVARKFAELHGGKVWAESEGEGKGSSFYIELPVK